MNPQHASTVAIENVEGSSPALFQLTRVSDGKSLAPVAIASPYEFPVAGRPESSLMRELRWYLEQFLDYPFHPETDHADMVLDALRAWGAEAFHVLFDQREAGGWIEGSSILQVRAADPRVLSWPWEALYDPKASSYVGHQRHMERQLVGLPEPPAVTALPKDRINILLVVCRPYRHDVGYRSIARPLIELIRSKKLPVHVDILRPPTFRQLREHLRQHPGYYHVLHFDGHGVYGDVNGDRRAQDALRRGYLIFENEEGEPDRKSGAELSALLRTHAVPLAVLNACQSAMVDEQAESAFASVATAFLQSGMYGVVAMAYSLYVSGAQVFLPEFYRCLFESGSVAEGVRAGRQQMLVEKKRMSARGPYPLEDWLLPVLYQQAPLNLTFAGQATVGSSESRLPQEVLEPPEALGFIGRDGPILELERALQHNAPCILVQGLSGVGKTTLARGFLHWIDETGGLDAALWFDFRSIHTAESVINRTGEAFCGENFGAKQNKLNLLADALHQVRVLIVWDNFESATQNLTDDDREGLRHFLDAIRKTRARVIMTSRSQEEWLAPEQRVKVPREGLGGLDGEERWEYCEAVLRELPLQVDRNNPDLKNLMDQLAGHPLAMRVVLSKMELMSAQKISEALRTNIAELGLNEQEEQGRLFGTLRFVEHGLPDQLRPIMSLITLHEAYLTTDLLGAMAHEADSDWTRQRVDQLLTELSNAGLVWYPASGACEIHPLLTSYLRSRGEAPEACQRAFAYVMAWFAEQLTEQEYPEQRVPFLLHGANLRLALQISKRLAIEQYVGALTQSLASFAKNSRNFGEAGALVTEHAEHAIAHGDREGEASAYHQLGNIAEDQGELATARVWYLKSLAISEKEGILRGAVAAYFQLGHVAQEHRDLAKALEWYRKALAISEKMGDLPATANAYRQMGTTALKQDDVATAHELYMKSRAIDEEEGNLTGLAVTYHQLGKIAQMQNELTGAKEWYLKSLNIEHKLGNLHGAALTYHNLGAIAADQRDYAKAREWYLESLTIKEQQGDWRGAAMTYHQLGIVSQQQHDFATAREWYLKSLAIAEKFDMSHYAISTYYNLGQLALEQRDFATARGWYLKVLAVEENHVNPHIVADAYGQLGVIAGEAGNFLESGQWLARAIAAFRQDLDQQGAERNIHNFLYGYRQASPAEKEKMKAAWMEASLGPLPEATDTEYSSVQAGRREKGFWKRLISHGRKAPD